jgi:hypothetical protein
MKQRTWNSQLRRIIGQSWEQLWTKYLQNLLRGTRTPVHYNTSRNRSELQREFIKPLSSLVTQIRTEMIGLNSFLSDRKVPGYSLACECGWSRQDAKHVIMFCPQQKQRREELYQAAGTRDYRKMFVTSRGVKAAATFIQATNLLPQFQLGLTEQLSL